jgi:sugar/nucleoside kinase (ribokinase family)
MRNAIVAGHICVDLVPALRGPVTFRAGALEQVGPIDVRIGGCVANTGVALADLGAPVRLEARVGDDVLGGWLRGMLDAIVPGGNRVRPMGGAATSYSIAIEPPSQDRMFLHHVGANAAFDGADLDVGGAGLLHVGYLTLLPGLLRGRAEPLRELLARARRAGLTTSIDLAVDQGGWQVDWPEILAAVLPLVDVVSPSVDDVASMLGRRAADSDDELDALAAELIDLGAGAVLLTAGPRGMLLRGSGRRRLLGAGELLAAAASSWADQVILRRAPPVNVVSTVGAGDAASAGLLYGILAALGPDGCVDAATRAAAHRLSGRWRLPRFEALEGPG